LLDANGKPTNASQDTPLIVQAVEPSGKIETIKTQVSAGSSSEDLKFQPTEPGLTKLTVTHPEKRVLGSSNYVLITPQGNSETQSQGPVKKAHKKKIHKVPTSRIYPSFGGAKLLNVSSSAYDLISYDLTSNDQTGDDQTGGGTQPSGPHLMLQLSGEHDSNVRADGTNYERVAVYYMDSQPPKAAIKVWLTWDHGEIQPNPLVIKKGEFAAEGHWTSGWPVKNAKVAIANVQPALPVQGSNSASMNFVEPISGVAFFNPPKIMSIVDESDLHARFYDISGNFVRTSDKRKVTFSTSSPIVKFQPGSQEMDWDFPTMLTPTGWGTELIEVATPGYPPFTHTLVITYVGVVLLCLAGGLLGSLGDLLTNRNAPKGWRILARFMVGALAAVLACWAYVIVGMPQAPSGIFHSRIAVLGVSLVGGWAGIVVVRRIAKTLLRVEI
jgi:hypothetical protein